MLTLKNFTETVLIERQGGVQEGEVQQWIERDFPDFKTMPELHRNQIETQIREYLDTIIQNYPKGDKWLVSHAMAGLIYNRQGQSGKAIPVLESALQHQPNPDLLKIIHRLLKLAKEGAADASS